MTKIFIVTSGQYSDYGILAVSSSKEKAIQWIHDSGWKLQAEIPRGSYDEPCYVEDYELDPEPEKTEDEEEDG